MLSKYLGNLLFFNVRMAYVKKCFVPCCKNTTADEQLQVIPMFTL